MGNSNVGDLSARGLVGMWATLVVELPSPEGANSFLIMLRNARSRFLVGCEAM